MSSSFYRIVVFVLLYAASFSIIAHETRPVHEKQNQAVKSGEQVLIENQLSRLKREDNPSNLEQIIQLNSRLEALTGMNRTMFTPYFGGELHSAEKPVPFLGGGDFIQNRIIYNNLGVVHGIAAAIEQRGPTAGKIWAVTIYTSDTLHPDTLRVFYSVNGGVNWTQYVTGNVRPYDKLNPDDLDMELIENVSGQKYLWVTFGYRQNYGTGAWAVGGFALQVPSLNGTFFNILNWPGGDSTKRYYNIRITSDNARYAGTPFIFVACSFDSLDANGIRVNSQKFARCLNPFSISTINFSFLGQNYYWSSSNGPAGYQRTAFTDIAYFNNGGNDSVEVSFSGVPDSTKIYFAKSDINGNPPVSSIGAGGPVGGSEPGDMKTYARLSTNGNDNGSVICTFRQYTGNNWYVKWFRSNDYGNFGGTFNESILWGSPVNPNFQPDIVGVRNGNTHYLSFLTSSSEDSIHYISVTSAGATNHTAKMNYYSASEVIAPKPVFRYTTDDSCLLIYSEDGLVSLVSAAGCSGETIGIHGNSTPASYALFQNYPNPFNPVTTIKFSIPKREFVRLSMFDALGRKAAPLYTGELNGGTYEMTFDGTNFSSGIYFFNLSVIGSAGGVDFSETKKMVLLK